MLSSGGMGLGAARPCRSPWPRCLGGESIPPPKPAGTRLKLWGNRDRAGVGGGAAPPGSSFRGKLDCLKDKKLFWGVFKARQPRAAERLRGEAVPMAPSVGNEGFVEQPPPRTPRDGEPPPHCQVTSLPLPGPHERPQASRQLALLRPGAVVTCKRKKRPHERPQERGGHRCNGGGGRARRSDPSIPPSHPCDTFPRLQEQWVRLFLKVYFAGLGLPESRVRGWSGAGGWWGGGTAATSFGR